MTEPLTAPHKPSAGAVAVFLAYQQRWCADTSPVKVWEKSRRIGASWGEAGDSALLSSMSTAAGGMNCFYIGYMKEMAQDFIRDAAEFAKAYNLAAGEIDESEEVWFDGDEKKAITIYTLRFASGYRIEALSSAPRNLRGKQGRVILDEFAFHSQQAELLKAAMALLIWGGQVHVISTHNGDANPFNELIGDIRAGKKPYSLHRTTFQDAVNDGLYERVCLRTGKEPTEAGKAEWMAGIYAQYGDDADEELDCIPKSGTGVWLSRALIEARMRRENPVLRWKPPVKDFDLLPDHERTGYMRDWCEEHLLPLLDALDPARRCGLGEDFGRTGDLTVLNPFQIRADLSVRFPFSVELFNCPFDQQRECLFFICDRLPRLFAMKLDARGNGQYLAEKAVQRYRPRGVEVEAVMLSETWYRENTAPLKAAFEDGTIEIPLDDDHLTDLRALQLVRGVPRVPDVRSTGKDGLKRHGDAAVAYLLAYAASRSEAVPPAGSCRESDEDTYKPQAVLERTSAMFGRGGYVPLGRRR
jgi:phage FluMu gp28-like protein